MTKPALNLLAETPPPRRPGAMVRKCLLYFFTAVFAIFVFAGDGSSELISRGVIEMLFRFYAVSLVIAGVSFLVVCWRRGQLAGLLGSVAGAALVLFSLWVAYSSGKRGVALWGGFQQALLPYFLWIAGPVATGVLAHWKKRGSAIGWIVLSLMLAGLPLLMLLWIPDRYWDDGPEFSKGFVEFFDPYPAHLFRSALTFRTFVMYVVIAVGIVALFFWFMISLEPAPLK
jgi:hypothetical protein